MRSDQCAARSPRSSGDTSRIDVSGSHESEYPLGERQLTPADCRVKADHYLRLLHDAKTVDERQLYLKLARAWLDAALTEDDAPPAMPTTPRLELKRVRRQ
jgi:hypothetical protein